jgi:hypothetical protein
MRRQSGYLRSSLSQQPRAVPGTVARGVASMWLLAPEEVVIGPRR